MGPKEKLAQQNGLLLDVFAWLSNVLTSIMIIFLTKWVGKSIQGCCSAAAFPPAN